MSMSIVASNIRSKLNIPTLSTIIFLEKDEVQTIISIMLTSLEAQLAGNVVDCRL
jgi:hypothetical protein